ncbi:MAG: nitroreductase family protein [Victivallales bacterium]|nr:nitroreductase family protein [Victivallales bacterium]
MKEFLRRIKRAVSAWLLKRKTLHEARQAFRYDRMQFERHAGMLHLDRKEAALAEIVMGYHVLEKGLTMPRRRLGFGVPVVRHLIQLVQAFETRFGDDAPQWQHAIAVLRAYRELHQHHFPMPELEAFLARHPDIPAAREPHLTSQEFFAAKNAPFPEFAASRHVLRHFAGPVPKDLLEQALSLALTAPSACNRQHARLHVFPQGPLLEQLFALQGGSRGFGQDADKVIVVTADLSALRWAWERHDCYTNGGIFVMNLCYALHYHGIAHCILHWSVPPEIDQKAHALLQIPENEAIVQVIACGMPPNEFAVAASPRRSLPDILTWHE